LCYGDGSAVQCADAGLTYDTTSDTLTVNKVNANTIDPIYNINGKKYATYVAGMTGIKEETTGVLSLRKNGNKYFAEINFKKAKEASDIWLFKSVTDFGDNWENLVVILSAGFDGKVWYEKKPKEGKIVIYGEKEGEVSYRLTAPRFDHEKWPNISKDENVEGMAVILKNDF
jgi:hypothetical protein